MVMNPSIPVLHAASNEASWLAQFSHISFAALNFVPNLLQPKYYCTCTRLFLIVNTIKIQANIINTGECYSVMSNNVGCTFRWSWTSALNRTFHAPLYYICAQGPFSSVQVFSRVQIQRLRLSLQNSNFVFHNHFCFGLDVCLGSLFFWKVWL